MHRKLKGWWLSGVGKEKGRVCPLEEQGCQAALAQAGQVDGVEEGLLAVLAPQALAKVAVQASPKLGHVEQQAIQAWAKLATWALVELGHEAEVEAQPWEELAVQVSAKWGVQEEVAILPWEAQEPQAVWFPPEGDEMQKLLCHSLGTELGAAEATEWMVDGDEPFLNC